MNLPSALVDSLASGWAGDVGRAWLEQLPSRVAAAERRWDFTIVEPYQPGGHTSFVASAVTANGSSAVYKITIPHDEAVGEADALAAYGGDGAVRVLAAESDSFELLLERCSPGDSLWSAEHDGDRLDVACSLMTRLWRPVDSDVIPDLGDVASAWADVTTRRISTYEHPWTPEPIERGIDLLRTLPGRAPERVLVHGDFHPGNVLRSEREPWLVIDPKPMFGDPAFEPVQLLTQSGGRIAEPPPPTEVEDRLVDISSKVGVDANRVGLWAIARTAEWSLWSWDHGDTIDAAIAYTWARTLHAIIPEA